MDPSCCLYSKDVTINHAWCEYIYGDPGSTILSWSFFTSLISISQSMHSSRNIPSVCCKDGHTGEIWTKVIVTWYHDSCLSHFVSKFGKKNLRPSNIIYIPIAERWWQRKTPMSSSTTRWNEAYIMALPLFTLVAISLPNERSLRRRIDMWFCRGVSITSRGGGSWSFVRYSLWF